MEHDARGRRLYGFAVGAGLETGVLRLGGVGLANLLFSWARCSVFCKKTGAVQVFTTWPQFKPKSWTRWESDKRHYCGMFRPLAEEIHGLKKLLTLMSVPWIAEDDWNGSQEHSALVVFRGLRGYFRNIWGEEGWIREHFLRSVKGGPPSTVAHPQSPYIAVHVRLGDHPLYDPTVARTGNMKLPLSWYERAIEFAVSELGWQGDVAVCSDATREELRPILQLPRVRLFRGGSAIEDLIFLSRGVVLIGSASTFSQWAAYLGGRPSIWHPQFERNGGLGPSFHELVLGEHETPAMIEKTTFFAEVAATSVRLNR